MSKLLYTTTLTYIQLFILTLSLRVTHQCVVEVEPADNIRVVISVFEIEYILLFQIESHNE